MKNSMDEIQKVLCQRCGCDVQSFSPMRKWCVECRRVVSLEQARARKYGLPNPVLEVKDLGKRETRLGTR
jgi:hypothetical protein